MFFDAKNICSNLKYINNPKNRQLFHLNFDWSDVCNFCFWFNEINDNDAAHCIKRTPFCEQIVVNKSMHISLAVISMANEYPSIA